MGNLGSKSAATSVRKLQPYKIQEIEALNKIAEKEQARLREIASFEELAKKDECLDSFLYKLGGSVSSQSVVVSDKKKAKELKPRTSENPFKKHAVSKEEEPGRIQTMIIKEVLEARTVSEIRETQLDLKFYNRMYGADTAKMEMLMKHACLPIIGRVPTLAHEYAFARFPFWFRESASGLTFVSEPLELRKRVDSEPVPQEEKPKSFQQLFGSRELAAGLKRGDDKLSDNLNEMLMQSLAETRKDEGGATDAPGESKR